MSFKAGEILLGRYELISKIGVGGYGAVFKARQASTGQLVAVKMLLSDRLNDRNTLAEETGRFLREMKLIALLSHPHIVHLIDSGVSEGRRLMILEYVDGQDLGELLRRNGPVSPAVCKRIIAQVLDALSEAHGMGIIHRDLKPQNIMLTGPSRRPNAKVLDFGIADITDEHRESDYTPLTQKGMIPGTPSYMAPEQIRCGTSTPASDLYSLGLIMLECLTGKRAVTGQSIGEICVKQITEQVYIPDEVLHSPLGSILERACSKQAEDRYESAEAMLAELERVDVSGNVPITTGTVRAEPEPTPSSNRFAATGRISPADDDNGEATQASLPSGERHSPAAPEDSPASHRDRHQSAAQVGAEQVVATKRPKSLRFPSADQQRARKRKRPLPALDDAPMGPEKLPAALERQARRMVEIFEALSKLIVACSTDCAKLGFALETFMDDHVEELNIIVTALSSIPKEQSTALKDRYRVRLEEATASFNLLFRCTNDVRVKRAMERMNF